ncbi:MAG: helix-hairpin-helix domain-containing protein [Bacteroidetes bacterium]|nr:helix-hairpin-helix domain-containing protein [Bacteroidota bacterium]
MKNNWRDYVQFSNSERRGIIVLSFLAVLCASYNYFVPQWVSNRQLANFEANYAEALLKARHHNDSIASINEWQEETALVEHLKIDSIKNIVDETLQGSREKQRLELNTMTARQLIKQNIVDDELAYRIIKFRDGLGGFYSKSQLKEVFGVTNESYEKLMANIDFNSTSLKRININKATQEELQLHSYISQKLAKQILNYREKVKPFASSEDVLKLYLVDEALHQKLIPYLEF